MKKLSIYTGGFALYFMGFLAVSFSIAVLNSIYLPILSLLEKSETVIILGLPFQSEPLWIIPFGIIIFGWGAYYFISYLFSNEIIIDDNFISIKIFKRPGNSLKNYFFVQKKTSKLSLSDIEAVILGTGKYLDKSFEKKKFRKLEHEIDLLKNETSHLITGRMAFPFPVWLAMKHTPFCYFRLKNGNDFFIDTKPFAKKDFIKIILKLKELNITVKDGDLNLI
jgi:hypothetical protein